MNTKINYIYKFQAFHYKVKFTYSDYINFYKKKSLRFEITKCKYLVIQIFSNC